MIPNSEIRTAAASCGDGIRKLLACWGEGITEKLAKEIGKEVEEIVSYRLQEHNCPDRGEGD